MRWKRRLSLVAAIGIASGCGGSSQNTLLISAASDLQEVSAPLAEQFRTETGIKVQFNFAASGTLAQQIEAGARPDVFASANVEFVERLARAGFIEAEAMRIYAKGRLVVVTAKSTGRLQSLGELNSAGFTRIAVANPVTAPYGAAAMQAIESAGLLESLKPRLIFAENVRQAFQYVKLGEVDAAFVSASLVAGHSNAGLMVSESLHRPLLQACARLKNSSHANEAKQFVEFLCSEAGRRLLEKYGLEAPPGATAKP